MRNTAWMATSIGRELAAAVAKVIERKRMSISDVLGWGLAKWLEAMGEPELAAMVLDGRGTQPRQHLRHK